MKYNNKEVVELSDNELSEANLRIIEMQTKFDARLGVIKTLPESTKKKRLARIYAEYPINQPFAELANEIDNEIKRRGIW